MSRGSSGTSLRDSFFEGTATLKPREVAVMDTGAAEHVIPQWATDLHSLKHFIKKAFRGRTSDSEEGKVGHHPERGPSELNSMYEYEYVIKNQFETYPSNYSFKTIRCKREDTRGVNGTFSLSRKNKAFCSQLGNPNAGPLGPSVYSRGTDRILIQPLSRKETFPGSNVCTGQSSDARRDCFNDKEGSHCRALKERSPGGLLLKHVPSPKKGRENETSHKSKTSQSVCSIPPFKDGGYEHSKRPCPAE